MIRWTGLAPWEIECHFPGSRTSTFLASSPFVPHGGVRGVRCLNILRVTWPREGLVHGAAVERMWHSSDSRGQMLALACRYKSLKRFMSFHLPRRWRWRAQPRPSPGVTLIRAGSSEANRPQSKAHRSHFGFRFRTRTWVMMSKRARV